MIRPSHTPRRFVAQKVFTDREDAIRHLAMALDGPQEPHKYRVLVFYGVGGQGKTALKREFERMLDDRARRGREAGDERRLGVEEGEQLGMQALDQLAQAVVVTRDGEGLARGPDADAVNA